MAISDFVPGMHVILLLGTTCYFANRPRPVIHRQLQFSGKWPFETTRRVACTLVEGYST